MAALSRICPYIAAIRSSAMMPRPPCSRFEPVGGPWLDDIESTEQRESRCAIVVQLRSQTDESDDLPRHLIDDDLRRIGAIEVTGRER